jgi:hypothetical protein
MRQILPVLSLLLLCVSCEKENEATAAIKQLQGNWVWTIQWSGSFHTSTPQSTGIHEILSFNSNGSYSISKNGTVVNTGTYKTAAVTNENGDKVARIQYSNARVIDSTTYFIISHNNDSLAFGGGMMGIDGTGSKHYGRQ